MFVGKRADRERHLFKKTDIRKFGEPEPNGRIVWINEGAGNFSLFVAQEEINRMIAEHPDDLRLSVQLLRGDTPAKEKKN